MFFVFFFKQKTAYEMRISDWSSDVCSSDLIGLFALGACASQSVLAADWPTKPVKVIVAFTAGGTTDILAREVSHGLTQKWGQSVVVENRPGAGGNIGTRDAINRSEEPTSELQSLMRISYAVFCLKKTKTK